MELTRSTSRRGFSVRSIFTFVFTVLVTALLLAISASPTSRAADINASWNGDSILYDGHQYYRMNVAKAGESHGLPAGTEYYTYIETVSERPAVYKAHVIYFPTGADPPKATAASYRTYDFGPGQTYSNPGSVQSIAIEPAGTGDDYETSCAIEGVGWLVCAASVWLADGMDWLFGVLSSMMAAQPLVTGDANNDLYVAWNVMRSFANIAFIIVFIIIIYSQLTNFGVDNYGIKKLIPRLIIAALLVNLSFYVCALFLDLSNIAGYSLQDIFIQIRESTFNIDEDTWSQDVLDWKAVTGFILSGGTVGFLGISAATAGSLTSAAFLLVPILLGLLLTAIFVLIILAARQAIIIILIVVAPLAFVAYLLPNTEKWFERWRDLFTTMLIFFPAFSLVFGGSQLAGAVILQNATNIVMLIFGLAVQIAPLVITPLLLKLSGGLLGKIAGIVNDPRKGLMDRTRNWSKDRAEMWRQRSMANKSGIPGARWLNPFRFAAKRMDNGNRNVKGRTEAYSMMNENRYKGSRTSGYRRTHELEALAGINKETVDNAATEHAQTKMAKPGTRLNRAVGLNEAGKARLEKTNEKLAKMRAEIRVGRYATNDAKLRATQRDMQRVLIETASYKQGTTAAQYEQQLVISSELSRRDSSYLPIAQGIGGDKARVRARASALAALDKLEKDARDNNVLLLRSDAKEAGVTVKEYTGDILKQLMSDDGGIRAAARAIFNKDQEEAAWEVQADDGQVDMMDAGRANEHIDQAILDRVIERNNDKMKSKGGFHNQANPKLSLLRYLAALRNGDTSYGSTESDVRTRFKRDQLIARLGSLSETTADALGGVKQGTFFSNSRDIVETIASMDADLAAARTPAERAELKRNYDTILHNLHNAIQAALTEDSIYATMTDRLPQARHMDKVLSRRYGKTAVPKRPTES